MKRIIVCWFCLFIYFLCGSSVAQSFDSLQNIRITVTFIAAPSVYNVSKAPLRFNKLFAFSMEEDDGGVDIYSYAYPFLNGGTVAGTTYPGLKYTDGCGNDQKFKMSASVFPFVSVGSDLVDCHDPATPYSALNTTWPELIDMYRQNWGVLDHGLTSGGGGTPSYEVARNTSYMKLKMLSATDGGPDEKIFVNPNGGEIYSDYAWAQGYTICYREGYPFADPSLNVSGPFPHQNIGMHRTNSYEAFNLSNLVDIMANTSTGGAHKWGVTFTHAVNNSNYGYSFATFQNHMNYIANTYGKNGLDNILMTSEEEVIDYLMVRDSIHINTQLSGNVLTISFNGPLTDKYRFYNSTLLLSADQTISSITTQGVRSSSFNGQGLLNGMVNISWNGHYTVPPEVNAETWVSKTESSHSQEDANVAMDYILMVAPGPAQHNFRIRLCQVSGLVLPSAFCANRNAPVCRIPDQGGCPGHTLVLPVLIDSGLNITGCYQRIEYDPSVMTFISGAAGKPAILSGMTITDQPVGGSSSLHKILVSWTGSAPQSLTVHDTLVRLTFSYISGNASVTFNTSSNSGIDCRYTDEGGNPMYQYPPSDYYFNGNITNARLVAPGSASGPSSLCQGTTGNMYNVPLVAGAVSYEWNFPSGFTISQGAGTDTVVVTAGPDAVSGTVTVRAVNVCNDNPLSPPLAVTMKSRPVPVISGATTTCAMSAGMPYSTDAGMTDYVWTVSSGGNIVSGQGTKDIAINWNTPGAQTVSLVYRGANGCLATVPSVRNVTVHPIPLPSITGIDTACRTGTYTFSTDPGNQSYQWQVSPSGIIVSGSSTSVINVMWSDEGPQWISLNYSNAFGCQALSPVIKNIFIRPIAEPVIAGPDSLCEGTIGTGYTTLSGMIDYSWTIPSGGTIVSGAGTPSIFVNWNNPGIHQVLLNYSPPGGCAATNPDILPVHIHARPLPHINGPDSLCKGSAGILFYTESGMNNYLWTISAGGTILSGAGTDSIMTGWPAAGNQDITLTYKNPYGCAPIHDVIYGVRIHPLPLPSIGGATSACYGSTGNHYTTQEGKTNYTWTISSGGIISSGQGTDTIHVTWNSTGLHEITVNYLDSNLCMAPVPASISVMVNPIPAPGISGPSSACSGLTVVYSTQLAMTGYTWSVSSGGTILSGMGTSAISVKWNQAGPGFVSVNYANSSGCYAMNPFVLNVTVNPSPAPSVSGAGSLCMNSSATYVTQSGMNNYSWTVSTGGTIVSGSGSPSVLVNWNSSGDQNVSLTCINTFGCGTIQPVVKPVRVHPLPLPVINGPSDICCYSSNQVYVTQHGKTAYHWTISSGGIINSGQGSDSIHVTWNSAGIQHLTITFIDSNGCNPVQPASYSVTVNPLPSPSITGSSSVCEGVTGNVYSTQAGMSNYLWNISSGGTILSGAGTEAIQVRWDSAGARFVSVNYSNSHGCFALAPFIKAVTVHPLPVPTITGSDSLCMNATGVYSTESGMHNYQWTISPGGSTVTGLGTNTIYVTWTTAGPRTVSVNYMNENNCMATSPVVFHVDVFSLPVPAITGNSSVCANSEAEIYTTESGMFNYVWNVSAGGTITSGQGTDSIVISWGASGNASISVTYATPKGCNPVSPAVIPVIINPRPIISISGSIMVCLNSGTRTYSTQPGQQNYTWNISPADTILNGQGTASVTVQWAAPGNQWISVNYSSPSGCEGSAPDTLQVLVNPIPEPASSISGPSILCAPASWQEYSVAPISNASGYYWTIPAGAVFQGSSGSNVIHISYLPGAQSGEITVYGTNSCGNGSPSSLFVTVNPTPPQPGITLGQDNTLLSNSVYGNQWYLNNQPLQGDTINSLHVLLTGSYFTIVTLNNCVSDTSNIKFVIAVGVHENDNPSIVEVHPNPTDGFLILNFTSPHERNFTVTLFNELGQPIYHAEKIIPKGESSLVLDIGNVYPGPVLLVIQSSDQIIRKKIIKN
ncbi:MAG: T9SS type A sorting domain-containing protein [Bacteroidetes bacterium]|nr:T9SS type A sorting domain-containing protein [Bacteroidota bacterium]